MAGRLNVALEPNAGLPFHVVLPSIALRSRKDAVPDFPHQAGHHLVARELGLTESAVRAWVRQAGIDTGHGPAGALTTEEREEPGRLRRELRTVRMERGILKKATAFFAKESE